MPTLEQAIEKFQSTYNIPVNFEEMETTAKKFSFLENNNFVLGASSNAIIYRSCLEQLLHSYVNSRITMTAGKNDYDLSGLDIVKFVNDYEEMMAVKNEQTPNRQKYEGLSKSILGYAMDNLKYYDKPLTEIWADKVTMGLTSFEDFAAFADAENDYVVNNLKEMGKEALRKNADNVFLAKKAMDKIWENRGIFWIISHPLQAVKEYNYKNKLNDCVTNLAVTGGYKYPDKNEYSYTSMIQASFEKVKAASAKKASTVTAEKNNEVKKEEVKSPIDQLLQQKATSWSHSQKLRDSDIIREAFQTGISNAIGKYKENASREAMAGATYFIMSKCIDEFWGNFNKNGADKDAVIREGAKKTFAQTYKLIETAQDMSIAEKVVAAQKISNLLLITISPAASDEKYAQYTDNYYLKNATPESIKEITGYEGNAQDLLNEARFEIGIDDKLKMDLSNVVNEKQEIKENNKVIESIQIEGRSLVD